MGREKKSAFRKRGKKIKDEKGREREKEGKKEEKEGKKKEKREKSKKNWFICMK